MKIKSLDLFRFKDLVDKKTPFIVKFKSENCPICVDLQSDYEQVAENFPKLQFFDVDINEEEDLADLFIDEGVPTLFYINGKNFKEVPYPDEGYDYDSLSAEITKIAKEKK